MADEETTVKTLRDRMRAFVEARDWGHFHTPKNLAMALAVETSEVMEHFQWLDTEQSAAISPSDPRWGAVRDEVADVLCYLLSLANALGIDLDDAMQDKMRRNEEKYPVSEVRGRRNWSSPSVPGELPGQP